MTDLAGAHGSGVLLPSQVGHDDVDGPAADGQAQTQGRAIIVQGLQPHRIARQYGQASQKRAAVAAPRAFGIGGDEGDLIAAQFARQGFGLIFQPLVRVLQHLLQGDDIGVLSPESRDQKRPPRGPVPHVVPDVEGRQGQGRGRLWSGGPSAQAAVGRAGGERRGGCGGEEDAA